MKRLAQTLAMLVALAACNDRAAKPAPATPAPKSLTTQAAETVDEHFGNGVITHDTVEDGTAVCGYISPKNVPATGRVFVFADGHLTTQGDAKPDVFEKLVSQKCPDFVLRPNL